MRIHQIDAFTDRPFAGNPAAVCLLSQPTTDRWMQAVASEMNLSETAFLCRVEDGFSLRWFTPVAEVDLCGHATLASAHFLWQEGELVSGEEARFHTRSGLLTAVQRNDWIEMDFPSEPPERAEPEAGLVESVGVTPLYVGRNRFDYLLEVESEEVVRAVQPDYKRLGKVSCRGVMVTSRAESPRYDFISRFFAPAEGIDEDPVTGSAHCCLGPYWARRLGKKRLVGFQASPRGGVVDVELVGSRIRLRGQAVTVLRADLQVPPPTPTV